MNVGRNPLQGSFIQPRTAMAKLYRCLVSVVLIFASVSVTQVSSEKVAQAADLSWENSSNLSCNCLGIGYGAGKFVMFGQNSKGFTSTDGLNWTQVSSASSGLASRTQDRIKAIIWGTWNGGEFLAFHEGENKSYTSANGETWSTVTRSVPSGGVTVAAFGANNYVITSGKNIYHSRDPSATTWNLAQLPFSSSSLSTNWSTLAFYGDHFVVAAGKTVLTSTNGIDWTGSINNLPSTGVWYRSSGGLVGATPTFILVQGGNSTVSSSQASVIYGQLIAGAWSWSQSAQGSWPTSLSFNGATFAFNRFWIQERGAPGKIWSSPDGTSWTQSATSFAGGAFYGLASGQISTGETVIAGAGQNYSLRGRNTLKTISYSGGSGGSGNAPISPLSFSAGTTFIIPANTYSRAGYLFNGWSDGATTYLPGATYPSSGTANENVTLTAQWTISTYLVSFDANGGTGSVPGEQTKTHGEAMTLASNSGSLVRTGYTFGGWNTAADGSGTSYAVGASYGVDAAVTLYAKWTANSLTITYNSQEGSSATGGSLSTTTGGTLSSLPTTSREGYAFNGLFTASTGG